MKERPHSYFSAIKDGINKTDRVPRTVNYGDGFYDSCVIDVPIVFGIMRRDYAKRQEERCRRRSSVGRSESKSGGLRRELKETRKIGQNVDPLKLSTRSSRERTISH